MSPPSQNVVSAIQGILNAAAPGDPRPEAVNAALLPLVPVSEQNPSVWIKLQYLAVVRRIAEIEGPPGALDDEHFFEQTKQCIAALGAMFPNGEKSFPTADYERNVTLCLKVYNMGKSICSLAEQRLGITHLRKRQEEKANERDGHGDYEPATSGTNRNYALDDNRAEVKQEILDDMPVLESQVSADYGSTSAETSSNLSESDSETYYQFTIKQNPETHRLELIVHVDPNRGYKYSFNDEINQYMCVTCPAQARVINVNGQIGGQVVKTTSHYCDPVLFNPNVDSQPLDGDRLSPTFASGSHNAYEPVPKRRRFNRPYCIEYTEFFFGLSSRNNPTKLFARSNATDRYYEYNYVTHKLFVCVRCKEYNMNTTINLTPLKGFGQQHHPACFPVHENSIRPVQELRRILAKMTHEEVQVGARNRFFNNV
uniref:Clathrin assembly protein n=1 Tax=Panagrellus redivivus TaxID=6233 RepID=A0A7E4UMJ8_PANRE